MAASVMRLADASGFLCLHDLLRSHATRPRPLRVLLPAVDAGGHAAAGPAQ